MKAEWYKSLWRDRCIDLYFDGEFVVPQDRPHYCNCAPDPLNGNWTGDCDYRALHWVGERGKKLFFGLIWSALLQ